MAEEVVRVDVKALNAVLKPLFQSWVAGAPKNLTPEELYKYFIHQIGSGFAQVTADSLGSIVGMMEQSGDANLIFAANLISQGPGLAFTFPTPGLSTAMTQKTAVKSGAVSMAGAKPGVLGGAVSVGGSWTF